MNHHFKCKMIKLLEENLSKVGLGKEFLDLTPEVQSLKGKIDKMELVRMKNFCSMKDKRMKRQARLISHIFNKRLVSRIHKELSRLNS